MADYYCPPMRLIRRVCVFLGGYLILALLVPELRPFHRAISLTVSGASLYSGNGRPRNITAGMRKFYAKYGYTVEALTNGRWAHLPILKAVKEPNCRDVFGDWKSLTSTSSRRDGPPPLRLEPVEEFTLGGRAPSFDCYKDDTDYFEGQTPDWSEEWIEQRIEKTRKAPVIRHPENPYPDAPAIYYATGHYSVKGQVGAVIGTKMPWAELYCLVNGADLLITVDYHEIKMGHPRMAFLHAYELVRQRAMLYEESFDFVVSFSSIEHSGLGRYGDPVNPWADVVEAQKVRCLLKPGGLFFLGVPVGADRTGFNCHRFYGRLRLPFLMSGFELVDVFGRSAKPIALTDEILAWDGEGHDPHYVFVLRKI